MKKTNDIIAQFKAGLSVPISKIGLNTRAKNACLSAGIETLRDLTKASEKELRKRRLFGDKTIKHILSVLHRYGLVFGMTDAVYIFEAVKELQKIIPEFVPSPEKNNCIGSTIPGSWKIIVDNPIQAEQMLQLVRRFNVVYSANLGKIILTLKTV